MIALLDSKEKIYQDVVDYCDDVDDDVPDVDDLIDDVAGVPDLGKLQKMIL